MKRNFIKSGWNCQQYLSVNGHLLQKPPSALLLVFPFSLCLGHSGLVSIFGAFCSFCAEVSPSRSAITGSFSSVRCQMEWMSPPSRALLQPYYLQSTCALVQFLCTLALNAIGNWFMIYLYESYLSLLISKWYTTKRGPCLPVVCFLKHRRHSVNKCLSEWKTSTL